MTPHPNTLTETQLASMLEMQDGMNSRVNPDWVAANNNWHRAIQVEAVEAIEHHGWKWWKKQECDMVISNKRSSHSKKIRNAPNPSPTGLGLLTHHLTRIRIRTYFHAEEEGAFRFVGVRYVREKIGWR